MSSKLILQIAVPVPFRKLYDYLPLPNTLNSQLRPGIRIKIPFGKTVKAGILIRVTSESSVATSRLKPVLEYLDDTPLFDKTMLNWLIWVSQYYHHPLGETLFTALPATMRQAQVIKMPRKHCWQLNPVAQQQDQSEILHRAPKQLALYNFFKQQNSPLTASQLDEHFEQWRPALKQLLHKAVLQEIEAPLLTTLPEAESVTPHEPNAEQQKAIQQILKTSQTFNVSLLDGITGSGKTEVYVNVVAQITAANRQALILIPEIGLTAQLLKRFSERFKKVAVLHSGLNDTERYAVWRAARGYRNRGSYCKSSARLWSRLARLTSAVPS